VALGALDTWTHGALCPGLRKKLAVHILPVIYPPLVKGVFYQVNYGKLPSHVFVTCPAKTGEELTEKPKK